MPINRHFVDINIPSGKRDAHRRAALVSSIRVGRSLRANYSCNVDGSATLIASLVEIYATLSRPSVSTYALCSFLFIFFLFFVSSALSLSLSFHDTSWLSER